MDWRKPSFWIVQVVGTLLCIAAFVNIGGGVLNGSRYGGSLALSVYLTFIAVFALGLLLVFAGFLVKPKSPAGTK